MPSRKLKALHGGLNALLDAGGEDGYSFIAEHVVASDARSAAAMRIQSKDWRDAIDKELAGWVGQLDRLWRPAAASARAQKEGTDFEEPLGKVRAHVASAFGAAGTKYFVGMLRTLQRADLPRTSRVVRRMYRDLGRSNPSHPAVHEEDGAALGTALLGTALEGEEGEVTSAQEVRDIDEQEARSMLEEVRVRQKELREARVAREAREARRADVEQSGEAANDEASLEEERHLVHLHLALVNEASLEGRLALAFSLTNHLEEVCQLHEARRFEVHADFSYLRFIHRL